MRNGFVINKIDNRTADVDVGAHIRMAFGDDAAKGCADGRVMQINLGQISDSPGFELKQPGPRP